MTRRIAAAAALALALPALAYILPVRGILWRLGAKRAGLGLASLEVTGTLQASGAAAARVAQLAGLRLAGARVTVPARFDMKVPGRCRIELALPEAADADRPYAAIRGDNITGQGLDSIPAAVALLRSACALLAVPAAAGDADRAYAAMLGRRGVSLGQTALGRFDGRIAYVIGGRPRDAKPLAWVDKDSFQPLRLQAQDGNAMFDTRLLDWGSSTGGDWFPRAVEVWSRDAMALRFTTEKAAANPKLPDALF